MRAGLFSFLLGAIPANAGKPIDAGDGQAPPDSVIEKFFMQDYLLGTWGGIRPALSKRGVDFEFFYIGSVPTNFSGGMARGSAYQGALLMSLDLDTAKLGMWDGGTFHASGLWLDGKTFSQRYVGDLNRSNLVDFPSGLRLWEVSYEQRVMRDALSFKVGLLSVDRDFIVPELYGSLATMSLLNQTFFYPTLAFTINDMAGLPAGNHALATTPYSAPGVRIQWRATDKVQVRVAVYGGQPDFGDTGTALALRRSAGALVYFEAGYHSGTGKGSPRLPVSIKVGGYYHTDQFADIRDAVGANFGLGTGTRMHRGNYGVYLLAEKMLYREAGSVDTAMQGLTGFIRLGHAPADRNIAELGIDAGLVYKGLIPGRDYDSIAIAGSYLKMSNDLRRAQRAANAVAPGSFVVSDYEAAVEFSYKFQMAAWWTLQPSIQYAMHPGGSKAIPDAWVGIIQMTLRF